MQEIARELTLRAGRWEQEWNEAKTKIEGGCVDLVDARVKLPIS